MDRGLLIRISLPAAILLILLLGRSGCAGGWAGRGGVVQGEAGLSSGGVSVREEDAASEAPDASGAVLDVEGWRFTDADSAERTLASFRGQPFVATLLYTNCATVCPRIVEGLRRLQEKAGGEVRVVMFSLDPVQDTPASLRSFAEAHDIARPEWTLLIPEARVLPPLAAALGVAWQPSSDGGIAHSAVVALVDGDGRVVERRVGLGEEPAALLAAWKRLDR